MALISEEKNVPSWYVPPPPTQAVAGGSDLPEGATPTVFNAPSTPYPPVTNYALNEFFGGSNAPPPIPSYMNPAPLAPASVTPNVSSEAMNLYLGGGQSLPTSGSSHPPVARDDWWNDGSNAPPNVSNEAMNLYLGGGKSLSPTVSMSLPNGSSARFDPNDPHPEVAFAKQHFDTSGWNYQDWVRNSMRYWDVNDKDYYFRPGQPYGNPSANRPLGGGQPRGAGINVGGQGGFGRSGGVASPSYSPPMVASAAGTTLGASPMVTNAVPINVSGNLGELEIPDELWQFIPEQLRGRFGNYLMAWLRGMGYNGRGNIGRYGERSYQRPAGQTGAIWFTPEMFNAFADPETAKWARWLLGERGFTGRTQSPAAEVPIPPQG